MTKTNTTFRFRLSALLLAVTLAGGCVSVDSSDAEMDETGSSAGAAGAGGFEDEAWAHENAIGSTGLEGDDWETDVEPPPAPYEQPLAGFTQNTTQWASLLVTTTGARVIGGHDETTSTIFGLYNLDPYAEYVQLDLELSNVGIAETTVRDRDTWDLLLADGTRIPSVDLVDVAMLPGNTASLQLHYKITEGIDLAGAAIVLEGSDYGAIQPETVPLDSTLVRDFPRRIEGWVGRAWETDKLTIVIEEAMWDANHEVFSRPAEGMRSVWLRVVVTGKDDHLWYDTDDMRISVGGRSSGPVRGDKPRIDNLETNSGLVAFEVNADATSVSLLMPTNTVTRNTEYADERLEATLADTTLVELPSL